MNWEDHAEELDEAGLKVVDGQPCCKECGADEFHQISEVTTRAYWLVVDGALVHQWNKVLGEETLEWMCARCDAICMPDVVLDIAEGRAA